ncbi:hypothetical protein [Chitinophaga sp. GbtcB8]|uniref:hypothetical protein n=1 Tax=Chitinophaga sp. GbtcB8 TaxID=2824753 RepID=UPI001C300D77|nr:hypothetical protein [Chitinophaga sp. GbtcB8]
MKQNFISFIPQAVYRRSHNPVSRNKKFKQLRRKKIALIMFIVGMLLALIASLAKSYEWAYIQDSLTLGFAGYLCMISSAAYLLLSLLQTWR